jgi:hypothetical protein
MGQGRKDLSHLLGRIFPDAPKDAARRLQHTLCKYCTVQIVRVTANPEQERSLRCPLCRKFSNASVKFTHHMMCDKPQVNTTPLMTAIGFLGDNSQISRQSQLDLEGLSMVPHSKTGFFGNHGSRGVILQDHIRVEIRHHDCGTTETMLVREISVQTQPILLSDDKTNCTEEEISRNSERLLEILDGIVPKRTTPASAHQIERVQDMYFRCASRDKLTTGGEPIWDNHRPGRVSMTNGGEPLWYNTRLSQSFETINGTSRDGVDVTFARWVTGIDEFYSPTPHETKLVPERQDMTRIPMADWKHLFRAHTEIQKVHSIALVQDQECKDPHHYLDGLLSCYGFNMSKLDLFLIPEKSITTRYMNMDSSLTPAQS